MDGIISSFLAIKLTLVEFDYMPEWIQAIQGFPAPSNPMQLHEYFGLVNNYHRFVHIFSTFYINCSRGIQSHLGPKSVGQLTINAYKLLQQ